MSTNDIFNVKGTYIPLFSLSLSGGGRSKNTLLYLVDWCQQNT